MRHGFTASRARHSPAAVYVQYKSEAQDIPRRTEPDTTVLTICNLYTSMSATNVLESGRNVTKAAKKVTLTPPFELACQLVRNTITPSDLVEEQNRLQKVLRDDTLESIHKQLWYAGRKGNVSQLHHQKVIRRDIILTERARLHLVWSDKTIYIDEMVGIDLLFSDVPRKARTIRQIPGFVSGHGYM